MTTTAQTTDLVTGVWDIEPARAGFSATGQIRRSDYGIDFNAPVGLDGMLISDKVTVELEIQAVPAN